MTPSHVRAGFGLSIVLALCLASCSVFADAAKPAGTSPWHYQLYSDGGYAASDNDPQNNDWRNKSTTNVLGKPELFLAMGNVGKNATFDSRWGFEFGLQTGTDSEGLVTSPPPPASEPLSNADTLRHLYRANVSYLFSAGRGLRLTGGLINSYVGYESYLAIDNPNYTRAYILDTVPYFLVGLEAAWDVSEKVDLAFYLVTGYNYLTDPNDALSPGMQLAWQVSPRAKLTQNIYFGPDQAETDVEFWRFLSDTIVEWKTRRFLLAGAVDFGTEKQTHLVGQPRSVWVGGALWARWQLGERWSVALRPEFYWDRDGQITGGKQTIQAYTGTLKYEYAPRHHRLVGILEVRYDRSTGDGGGFYSGPTNALVPGQTLVLAGLLWSFGR